MNYEKSLEIIYSKILYKKKDDFSNLKKALLLFSNPHNKLKYVHIAGTNGKGTTSSYVASCLKEAGYKVGLFTSPFVEKFTERFKINSQEISEIELAEQLEKIENTLGSGYDLSFFEYITLIAFNWFLEQNCDIVVLEVGMGGRLDATNIIEKSLVSAICSISLDHTNFLGNSLSEIAREKSGIIKENSNLVIYPEQKKEALDKILEIASEKSANIFVASKDIKIVSESLKGTVFEIENTQIEILFTGYHQVLNASTAFSIIKILNRNGFTINEKSLKNGFKKAKISARQELICENPIIMLDGGHNPDCANALSNVIEKHLKNKKITAIIGMMSDKDCYDYIKIISKKVSTIITVDVDNEKAYKKEYLLEIAQKYCQNSSCSDINTAIINSLESDVIIICGSMYLMSGIKKNINKIIKERVGKNNANS